MSLFYKQFSNESQLDEAVADGGAHLRFSRAIRFIGIVYFPVLIVVGVASNAVVVAVMRRASGVSKSRDVFTALAVADLSVLLVNPVRYFITLAIGYDIRMHNDFVCALHTFLTYFLKEAATWILVLMSMERFLFARWPHHSNLHYRRRPKILTWTVALTILFAKNLAIFCKLRVDGDKCDSTDTQFRLAFFITTLVLYSLVPFILMVVFNATLIRIIRRANKLRQLMLTEHGREAKRLEVRSRGGNGGSSSGSTANKMLVPVCLLHICLTLPQCVFEIIDTVFGLKNQTEIWQEVSTVGMTLVMVSLLNNAINGFVYFFSSKNFRRNVYQLLRRTEVGGAHRANVTGASGGPGGTRKWRPVQDGSQQAVEQSPSPTRVSQANCCDCEDIVCSEMHRLAAATNAAAAATSACTLSRYLAVAASARQQRSQHPQQQQQPTKARCSPVSATHANSVEMSPEQPETVVTDQQSAATVVQPDETPATRVYLVVSGDKISHL